MNSKKLTVFALLAVCAVSLTGCEKKKSWHYEDYEYLNEAAVLPAVATSGTAESFVSSSYAERQDILGKLEAYAMKNNLTGITLYDDGGYVKYQDRVVFPTKAKTDSDGNPIVVAGTAQYEYISGYGFGIVSEGSLNGELSGVSAYKNYYNTFETADPSTLNYMNDKGSVVGDYFGYVASGYFDTRLSETKDSYEWYAALATDANVVNGVPRPLPQNAEEGSDLATKYRIYVKTGADAKYGTATTNASLTKYNGREVALEDYLTPFKELYNQSNGLARGAEQLTGAGSIKGMQEYYNATSGGYDETAWSKVGVKTGTDTAGSYLEFELNVPCTPFYAMYYLSSGLYTPIPADFLTDIGGIKIWGSFNENQTLTPVDTTLSTGPYVVEKWASDDEFVFKTNEQISDSTKGGANRYQIPGVHVDIMPGATSDPMLAFNEWSEGKLDAVAIPKDKILTEVGTKGTQQTKGSSTTKLNVNTCTEKEWEALFGENGSITQTPKSDYWDVEPAMSNDDFLKGINLSLNRVQYAQNRGVTPSINYFSDNYLSDPENGVSYNTTKEHNDALLSVYTQSQIDNYGFDFDGAVTSFKKAADALLASGAYKAGDKITIEIAWQAEAQIANNGADIKNYLESAFNDEDVCGNKLTLEVNNVAVAVWSDVYYKKMMVGQFDIGFGGISGNPLNPINFLEVLKSDNSSGFTLNWGASTNDASAGTIEYNGKQFTFDALFQAADTGTVVTSTGEKATTYAAVLTQNTRNEDGTRTIKIKYGASNIANVVSTSLEDVVLCWYEGAEYDEQSVEYSAENGVITITISQELSEAYQGTISFDLYFSSTVGTADPASVLISLDAEFPRYE